MIGRLLLFVYALMACDRPPVAPPEPALPDPVAQALAEGADLAACGSMSFPEAADICRLDLAVRSSRAQDPVGGVAACAAVQDALWHEECFFRIAEVLGRQVGLIVALQSCAQAGRFSSFCFIHAAWWGRTYPELAPTTDPTLATAIDRYMAPIEAVEAPVANPYWGDAIQMVRVATWFAGYYGTGMADPTAARAAPTSDKPAARSAFAWEATRLISAAEGWDALPAKVEAVWEGRRAPPTGAIMEPDCWQGRIPDVTHVSALDDVPRSHTVHGGQRLKATAEQEDLAIATLEAMFFHADAPVDGWTPWLDHTALTLRATAARLGVMSGGQDEAWQHRLSTLTDVMVRNQVLAARRHPAEHWTASPDRSNCP
jgi:hypothetical protein